MERLRAESESAEELTLSHVTGAAAVHMLFMRVALATTAREVLGMPAASEDAWWYFATSWTVLHYANEVNVAWVLKHKLDDYAYGAEQRLFWAKDAMIAAAEEM